MIRDYSGNSISPKRKAQQLLADALAAIPATWRDNESQSYTDREAGLIDDQLKKLCDRIARVLGYEDLTSCSIACEIEQ